MSPMVGVSLCLKRNKRREIWRHDPEVIAAMLPWPVVQPTTVVLLYDGKVFGTFDGRLIAVDANTGEEPGISIHGSPKD